MRQPARPDLWEARVWQPPGPTRRASRRPRGNGGVVAVASRAFARRRRSLSAVLGRHRMKSSRDHKMMT